MSGYIKAISYYLPTNILHNNQLNQQFPEWSADKISQKTGIESRHISREGECASDLAVAAAQELFVNNHVSPCDIDFILLCTQSSDYRLPTTACLVQERLGISTVSGALDFNLACSGFIYGLALANGLIVAGSAKNILLLTAETYSKYIKDDDKSNRTIFGDGAAAVLISKEVGTAKIESFSFGTDGRGAKNLIVKNGGSRFPLASGECFLYMNGAELFNFALEVVPKLIDQVLEANSLVLEQVDYFIFHQANQFMLETLRNIIGIPAEKFIVSLKNCGNTVSSTIPIALYEAIGSNLIKSGDRVLLAGFGAGYSWGAVILQF